ncbi:hypothetical protein PFISCL1PPCAC_25538, partial [Pristionchus fissidentatus]
KSKLLEVLSIVLPSISALTVQICLEACQKQMFSLEKIVSAHKAPNYEEMRVSDGIPKTKFFGIHLMCYNRSHCDLVMEMHFAAEIGQCKYIWDKIPMEYISVDFNGKTTTRHDNFNYKNIVVGSVIEAYANSR